MENHSPLMSKAQRKIIVLQHHCLAIYNAYEAHEKWNDYTKQCNRNAKMLFKAKVYLCRRLDITSIPGNENSELH